MSEQHNIGAHLIFSAFTPSVSRNNPNKLITVKFKPLANDANTDGSHTAQVAQPHNLA